MFETYNINTFKCRLCEEIIFAEHKSSTCPFCGAHDDYIVILKDYECCTPEIFTKESRENLRKALNLEQESVQFYRCSMSHTKNVKLKNIFQGIMKIEIEHVLLISKALKMKSFNTSTADICFRFDDENIETAKKRKEETENLYIDFYNVASEKRVQEIFFGLAEIEKDHEDLLNSCKLT